MNVLVNIVNMIKRGTIEPIEASYLVKEHLTNSYLLLCNCHYFLPVKFYSAFTSLLATASKLASRLVGSIAQWVA